MATFRWLPHPETGGCLTCGTAVNDRGFIDGIAEVKLMRQDNEIAGFADLLMCATCIEQQGRMVGMASREETEAFAYREMEKDREIEKLRDEVMSWQQRLMSLANLSLEDFSKLLALEQQSKFVVPVGATEVVDEPING